MEKYRAIPQGYMTVGELAKKNKHDCANLAVLRQRRASFAVYRK
jgi:hypothetical protein